MKNKVIMIVGMIIFAGMMMLGGFFFSSKFVVGKLETDKKQENKQEVLKEEKTEMKKDHKLIVLDSKIGHNILSKFCISNIYSNLVYNEIDQNGFSNDGKLLYTYATIVSNYEYHNLIKTSDEWGMYITKSDLEMVYETLFGKQTKLNHHSMISENLYHEKEEYYEYLMFGYGGVEFHFLVEIPYEIREYEDRVEVAFYRIYATSDSSMGEDGIQKQLVKLYEDKDRKKEIYRSEDVKLQQNDSQQEFLKLLIDDGTLKKEKLETITYLLKENNQEYYLDGVKK